MKLKYVLSSALLTIFIAPSLAQTDTLYRSDGEYKSFTKQEMQKMVKVRQDRLLENPNNDLSFSFKKTHERIIEDTLFIYGMFMYTSLNIANESEQNDSKIGFPTPTFSFKDIKGNPVNSTDYENQVVLINCWFTRCAPCIAEMPELNLIKQRYSDQDIHFLSMAPENKDQVKTFLAKHEFNYQHIADADNFLKLFGTSFPKNILIDKKGIIRYIGGGLAALDAENNLSVKKDDKPTQLEEMIDTLLAE